MDYIDYIDEKKRQLNNLVLPNTAWTCFIKDDINYDNFEDKELEVDHSIHFKTPILKSMGLDSRYIYLSTVLEGYFSNETTLVPQKIWLENIQRCLISLGVNWSLRQVLDTLLLLSKVSRTYSYSQIPLFNFFNISKTPSGLTLKCLFNPYF